MGQALRLTAAAAANPGLRRVVVGYAVFSLTEYAAWFAVVVYAYANGGASTAGLVAVAQLVPAALIAPVAAQMADRHSPAVVLAAGYAIQGVSSAVAAAAIFADLSGLAYAAAVVMCTATATTRPAQAVVLPALAREANELTAANVIIGWFESLGILLGGALVGVVLTLGNAAHVFVVCAVLLVGVTVLVAPLRARIVGRGRASDDPDAAVGRSFSLAWRSPAVRILIGLLFVMSVVLGALDLLLVVLAIDILEAGESWVGYLNVAFGAGGLLVGGGAILLIGRRLGPVLLLTSLVFGAGLAAAALPAGSVVAALLVAVLGGSRALFDVGVTTLLQRSAGSGVLGWVFGLAEGIKTIGLALGALLTPALVSIDGGGFALVVCSGLLPVAVLVQFRVLLRIDQHAQVPVVEIALLRSVPLFRQLPVPVIEGLALALERADYSEGDVIVRQGDPGDRYFVIADGAVEILHDGVHACTLGRADGFGEIALLRAGVRTATAASRGATRLYFLDRVAFLTAVNGHAPTLQAAAGLVTDVQRRDATRPPTTTPLA